MHQQSPFFFSRLASTYSGNFPNHSSSSSTYAAPCVSSFHLQSTGLFLPSWQYLEKQTMTTPVYLRARQHRWRRLATGYGRVLVRCPTLRRGFSSTLQNAGRVVLFQRTRSQCLEGVQGLGRFPPYPFAGTIASSELHTSAQSRKESRTLLPRHG